MELESRRRATICERESVKTGTNLAIHEDAIDLEVPIAYNVHKVVRRQPCRTATDVARHQELAVRLHLRKTA